MDFVRAIFPLNSYSCYAHPEQSAKISNLIEQVHENASTSKDTRATNGVDQAIGPSHARALEVAAIQIKAYARLGIGGFQPRTPCGYAKCGVVLCSFTPLLWLFNESSDILQPPTAIRIPRLLRPDLKINCFFSLHESSQ